MISIVAADNKICSREIKSSINNAKTQAEDEEWVLEALKFWESQNIKWPKNKKIQEQLKQFEEWAKKFK